MLSDCVSDQGYDSGWANNHACDNQHKGVMLLSGREVVVCCPGEPTDPFADGNLGYFGLISPVARGTQSATGAEEGGTVTEEYLGVPGAECDEDGCTYYPQCACPVAIPSLNMKTTGVPNMLPPVRVRRGSDCSDGADCASGGKLYEPGKHSNKTEPRIVIAPCVERGSYFSAYSVFIGNPDAAHLGDDVRLDNMSWTRIFEPAAEDAAWSVKAPPVDGIFDTARMELTPHLEEHAELKLGPIFIGSPGNIYYGKGSAAAAQQKGSSMETDDVRMVKEAAAYFFK